MESVAVVQKEVSFSSAVPVGVMSEIASARQAQEVQAAVIIAKKYPRDQQKSLDKLLIACTRLPLALKAIYTYPKGDLEVEGPTIRLVEEMVRCWENMINGVNELERREGSSIIEAFSWDLETNVRDSKVFEVPHVRYSKKGGNVRLLEARDIYEHIANYGARRKRACMLSNIPKDIQDAAVDECRKTLLAKIPVTEERIKKMLVDFEALGVTKEMIERRLQRPLNLNISPAVFVQLGGIYNSINDGMSDKDDWFEALSAKNDPGEVRPKAEPKAEAAPSTAPAADNPPPPDEPPSKASTNGNGKDTRTFKQRFEMMEKAIPKTKWRLWLDHYDHYLSDLSIDKEQLTETNYRDLIALLNNFLVGNGK